MAGSVRQALIGDADEIGRVHYRAHIETYSGKFPEGVIESVPASARARMWNQIIGAESGTVWVAILNVQIVGFACTGPSVPSTCSRPTTAWGWDSCSSMPRSAAEARPSGCWTTTRAHAFYARNGFSPDGTEKIDEGFGGVRDIRMVR